jgi:hypothetical protein
MSKIKQIMAATLAMKIYANRHPESKKRKK